MLEAIKKNLIRLVGPVAQGRGAASTLTQTAEVGLSPCCVQATRIGVPTSVKLGAYSPLEKVGMQLWAEEGPWAGRRLAAVDYAMGNNGPPSLCGPGV